MNELQEKIEILDKSLKAGFASMPRAVLRNPKLSRNSKATYSLLLDYAWQTGSCFPGQERLASDLGVSVRTIQRDLEELKNFGLIDWQQRGKNRTNVYSILPLDFLSDTTNMSDPDTSDLSPQDTTKTSDIIEEDEYTQKEYKQSLTSEGANDNEKLNLGTFDDEAIAIANELNDLKSIKYYQKLISLRDKGELDNDDIQRALNETRKAMSESQNDGTNFLKNPAAWFVANLKRFSQKREQKKQRKIIEQMKNNFSIN